jgi:hypothetical protein
MWLTRARPYDYWNDLICWLLLLGLLLRTGTRLAPDNADLGPFIVSEKVEAAGLLLAYGQFAMKCPVSRQLKHALALLVLVVTWPVLFCGALLTFWLLNWALGL